MRGVESVGSPSNNGMRYSEYFGDLLTAKSDTDRAALFFERLARFCADHGSDIRTGDQWESLAGRLGLEYHPEISLRGPAGRPSPDWESIDGLRLLADSLVLAAADHTDEQACRILETTPRYAGRYKGRSGLHDRLGAAREHFGWLLMILDEAEAKDFPAKAAFVATFSIAESGETPEAD